MRSFPTRRGRPPANRPKRDLGTAELAFKRAHGITSEPLDRCHQRGFITDRQLWAGMHLRWLYTLRYGTCDPATQRWRDAYTEHSSTTQDDPKWREAREEELHLAITELDRYHLYAPLRNLCIHHHVPRFLVTPNPEHMYELHALQAGLDILLRLWR